MIWPASVAGLNEVALGISVPKMWAALMARLVGQGPSEKLLQVRTLASTGAPLRCGHVAAAPARRAGAVFMMSTPARPQVCCLPSHELDTLPAGLQFAAMLKPREALRLGLVDEVVPKDGLLVSMPLPLHDRTACPALQVAFSSARHATSCPACALAWGGVQSSVLEHVRREDGASRAAGFRPSRSGPGHAAGAASFWLPLCAGSRRDGHAQHAAGA